MNVLRAPNPRPAVVPTASPTKPLPAAEQEGFPVGFFFICGAVLALVGLLVWSAHHLNRSLERERLQAGVFALNLAASENLDRLESALLQLETKQSLLAMAPQLGQDFPFLRDLEHEGGVLWQATVGNRSPSDRERHRYAMLILSERLRVPSQGMVVSLPQAPLTGGNELLLSWMVQSGAAQQRMYASISVEQLLSKSAEDIGANRWFDFSVAGAGRQPPSAAQQRILLAGAELPIVALSRTGVGSAPSWSWEQLLVPVSVLFGAMALFLCWQIYRQTRARIEGEAKLRDQETRIQQNAGLATLGEIATLVSHEINQPLAAMEVYASTCLRLLRQPVVGLEPMQQGLIGSLESIKQEVGRVGRIISSIKGLTEKKGMQSKECNLSEVVQQIEPLVVMQAKRFQMRVELSIDRRTRVTCDPSAVEQVLLNLIRNGLEAMIQQTGSGRTLRVVGELLDDHWAQVQVIDQGPGIAPGIQDQIFSPFFSTKSAGTGVGLSLCHSIIEKHGGRIWFESAPSGGTAFKFTLPRAQEPTR